MPSATPPVPPITGAPCVNAANFGASSGIGDRELHLHEADCICRCSRPFLRPCLLDGPHEKPHLGYGAAPLYGEWLCRVYDEWLREDNPTVHIRSFESLIRAFLGFSAITDAFGGSPLGYVVVETDGKFGALDSLRAVGNGLADTGMDVFQNSIEDVLQAPIIREMRSGREGLPETCAACPHATTCGGGYFPHRFRTRNRFHNPSVYCWDLFYLCSHIQKTLGRAVSHSLKPGSQLYPR